uniref:chemotaxis protein CheA n=1 Tax=Desulfococcus sp. TaxID=2025834 RepID=UPI0035938F5D
PSPSAIPAACKKDTQSLSATTQPGADAPPAETRRPDPPTEKTVKQSLRVDARKIDALMNQVGELVVSRAWFSQLHQEMRRLQDYLKEKVGLDPREMKPVKALSFRISEAIVALGRASNELQEGVMKVRMLPIAQLFNRYPRLVRDLVHDVDKKVHLEIIGEETELDKMVIEEISDPLIHLIRNAVDHGCETVPERLAAGKPEECRLCLQSYHESNHVVIEISDDGRGMDPDEIRRTAAARGIATPEELDPMSRRELLELVMRPGFSTAREVTRVSGRGVGMDVVRQNVERLAGTIEIDSRIGEGTRFRIKIPLTLAIIQALLVRVGQDIFTIPLTAVEETLRISREDVTTIEGVECIYLRNSTLSLLRLSELFGIQTASRDGRRSFVVVVNTGMRRVGLVVDALIGQEETVIKPLVDYLQESSGFSGATILGDGRISLILDVYELIKLSIGTHARAKHQGGMLDYGEIGGGRPR